MSSTLYGQDCSYSVEGQVFDLSTRQPLPFTTVQIKNTTKGATANENGVFRITGICDEEFDLIFSYVGYQTIEHHHDVYHDLPEIFLAQNEITLESVVVEGNKLEGDLFSGKIDVIDSRKINENRGGSLGNLLSSLSGVNQLQAGQNVSKPIIHGLHSNRVLIVNDGVRHEFQNWGTDHAPEIDASLINQVDVIKGAASVRYGPEALGGVVVIRSPEMDLHEKLNGSVTLQGESNGRVVDGSLRVQKGYDRTAFLLQASGNVQGDLRAPDYLLTNTAKNEWSTSFGARHHWKRFDVQFHFSHFEQELGLLRSSVNGGLPDLLQAFEANQPPITEPFSYEVREPNQMVGHSVAKVRAKWNGQGQQVQLNYAYQVNSRQEYDLRRGTAPSIDLVLKSHTLDVDWQHRSIGEWNGNVGIQTLYQDNNNIEGTNTIPFIPNYNTSRIGLYLIESRQLNSTSLFEFGLRYDIQHSSIRGRESNNNIYRNTVNFQNVSATAGIVKTQDDFTFRSNIGSAWRPPNIAELYRFGRHQSGFEYGLWRYNINENNEINTNNILDENTKDAPPEIGLKWVNNLEWDKENWKLDVTVYANMIMNYIFTRPFGITNTQRGAYPFFIFNQTDALYTGFDASGIFRHSNNWQSEAGISYVYATDLENNEPFVGIPPLRLNYSIYHQIGDFSIFNKAYISADFSYHFRAWHVPRIVEVRDILAAEQNGVNIFENDASIFDFVDVPEGYFMANLTAGFSLKKFNFLIGIDNLLNTTYRSYTDRMRYFADDKGFNFSFSIEYRF